MKTVWPDELMGYQEELPDGLCLENGYIAEKIFDCVVWQDGVASLCATLAEKFYRVHSVNISSGPLGKEYHVRAWRVVPEKENSTWH